MPKIANYFLVFFIVLSGSPRLHAELFKWVDEHGKVHYSDKAPDENRAAESKTIQLKQQQPGSPSSSAAGGPIIRPYERTARKLHLLETQYFWKKASASGRSAKIGAYHLGKGCTSRGAIRTPDVFVHHNGMLPEEHALAQHVAQVINGLDYLAEHTRRYDLINRLKKSGGLSLHSEITDLDIQTCAPNIRKSQYSFKAEQVPASRFTRTRINLTVKWQLKTNRDQTLVFETETHGRLNGWNKHTSVSHALKTAMESAVLELFSNRQFIDQILVQEEAVDLLTAQESVEPIRTQQDREYKKLFLDLDIDAWKRNIGATQSAGRALFGDKCSASKDLALSDIGMNRIIRFPDQNKANLAVIKRANDLGYSIAPLTAGLSTANGAATLAQLQAELVETHFEICAPSLPASAKYKPIDQIPRNALTRKRARVTIKWVLRSADARNILYQSKTTASAGDLLIDDPKADSLQEAMAAATDKLFAQPRFIEHITVPAQARQVVDAPFDSGVSGAAQPIIKPADSEAAPLFIVSTQSPWGALPVGNMIGIYAYGQSCTGIKKKTWPEALNSQQQLFPKGGSISTSQGNVIKSLGYPYRLTDETNVLNMKRKLGGFSLHSNIRNLRYDSCAAEIEQADKIGPGTGSRNFKRHRAVIDIDWQLYDQTHQHPVFVTTTQGVADSWLINQKGDQVLLQAVENATQHLFSNPQLIAILLQTDSGEKQEPGLLEKLFSMFAAQDDSGEDSVATTISNSYVARARLSQAIADLTAVKVPVTEYYMMQGEWPASLDDIRLSQSMFASSKVLSYVSIDAGGSIVGELDDSFGSGKLLRFTPDQNPHGMRVNWSCSSNLPREVLPQGCEHSAY